MIRSIFLILPLVFWQNPLSAQYVNLEVTLKFKQNYCGGARPSEEMEAEITRAKVFANEKMILVKGKKADTLTTDKDGGIKLRLRKGTYNLIEPWQFYKKSANGLELSAFDLQCMEKEWAKVCVRITIKKRKANVEYLNEIIRVCDWQLPCLKEGHQPPIPE